MKKTTYVLIVGIMLTLMIGLVSWLMPIGINLQMMLTCFKTRFLENGMR